MGRSIAAIDKVLRFVEPAGGHRSIDSSGDALPERWRIDFLSKKLEQRLGRQ